ncbi:MAG: DUF3536 domain-containing protein [Elusimicrobiaceae bacterium]|nr:DUF3536 domain-containing protein [Elusimicrobiaceae bacterium]MBP5616380.1 DUF3536 domain-containing protein [Elusimicrobiaceae bacterium]
MKYLCIHGHFYQPPRENAWLEEIELQESASPYHDWNARICAECYSPNTLARVLNGKKELIDLTNNYAHISFNFGPTLLSWLEEKEPEVYRAIIEADVQSRAHFGGHGSAIAQCYNHMILPLANSHDKETQIKWGIYDFEKRFGRKPEALWLAETACNTETLEVLAANGMKFVILAPGQCLRVRKIGERDWQDIGAGVDPKRAYLCNLPSGQKITLFFYDGPISQGIAFSDTLSSGEKFASRLLSTYTNNDEPQLMHIATDGETYGHHQKFAEMALAYCLRTVQAKPDVRLTVYGEFLEKNPPQYEAQIRENSSWSCYHGVERWRADCGCNSGMHAGWQQKWRGPLRQALDFIRDEMIHTYEEVGGQYFKDVWQARNDYISIILDRSLDAQHNFFLKYATEKAWNDRPTALMLLEMQRMAMLMYTSCGWFFDEVSGLETVQIMQYACRAMELNKALSGRDLEPKFIEMLAAAPSNLPEVKTGAVAYERYVKPQAASLEKMALSHIVTLLVDETANPKKAYACDVLDYQPVKLLADNAQLWYGTIRLKSRITLEEKTIPFAILRRKMASLICGAGADDSDHFFASLKELFDAAKYEECATLIRQQCHQEVPLRSMFMDVRRKVVEQIIRHMNADADNVYSGLFEREYPVVRALQLLGTPIPHTFLEVANFVLTTDLVAEFRSTDINVNEIEELMEDVKTLGLDISKGPVLQAVNEKLTFLAFAFARNPADKQATHKLLEFLNYIEIFGLAPDMVKAQEFVYFGLKSLGEEARTKDLLCALAKKLQIAL